MTKARACATGCILNLVVSKREAVNSAESAAWLLALMIVLAVAAYAVMLYLGGVTS